MMRMRLFLVCLPCLCYTGKLSPSTSAGRRSTGITTSGAARTWHGEIGRIEIAVMENGGSISVVPVGGTTTQVEKPLKFMRHQ